MALDNDKIMPEVEMLCVIVLFNLLLSAEQLCMSSMSPGCEWLFLYVVN
jgi:hypothetical protein